MKNPEEVYDLDSASVRTASITPNKGDDGEEIEAQKLNNKKVKYHCLGMKRTRQRRGRFHL
jgi:hypothetical protein